MVAIPDWLSDSDQWREYLGAIHARPPWHCYPSEFFTRLQDLNHRARVVAWAIFEQGEIDTQTLQDLGYGHPPRAKQDLQERGIAVAKRMIRNETTGRRMAVYSFAPAEGVLRSAQSGRAALPKRFVSGVKLAAESRCALCCGDFGGRDLQVDHRVPFGIGGDDATRDLDEDRFMAVCRPCNRAKSWTCEHCPNWRERDADVCASCYWAIPEGHMHVATLPIRRLDLTWQAAGVAEFDLLRRLADQADSPLPDFVRSVLSKHAQRQAQHLSQKTDESPSKRKQGR